MLKTLLLALIISLGSASSLCAESARWIDARSFSGARANLLPVTSLSFPESIVTPGQYYAALLDLDASSELREVYRTHGDRGRNFRFQQFHRGLEVFTAQLVVSESINGQLKFTAGRYAKGIDSEIDWTRPAITDEEAIERSIEHYRTESGRELRPSDFRSELMIARVDRKLHLVYLTFGGVGATAFVDARSGEVLDSWNSVPSP